MDKDFDGAEWASRHDSSFQTLIAKAKKAKSHQNVMDTAKGQGDGLVGAEPSVEDRIALEKQGNNQPLPDELSSALKGRPSRYPDQSDTGVFLDLGAGA